MFVSRSSTPVGPPSALAHRYWFLTNLQLALGRTLMGLHVAMHTTLQPPPPPPSEEPPASNASQGMHRISSGPGSVRTGLYGARGSAGGGGTDIPDELYDTAVPVDVAVSYKAFPWPSVTEDLGAASAAVFFNLLLVRGWGRGGRKGTCPLQRNASHRPTCKFHSLVQHLPGTRSAVRRSMGVRVRLLPRRVLLFHSVTHPMGLAPPSCVQSSAN